MRPIVTDTRLRAPDIIVGMVFSFSHSLAVFLSGQAGPALHRPGLAGLSGGFQMRAGPGLQAFPAGLAAFLGGLQAFLGGLSLNRIFCSKDSLLPLLRKSPKYET